MSQAFFCSFSHHILSLPEHIGFLWLLTHSGHKEAERWGLQLSH